MERNEVSVKLVPDEVVLLAGGVLLMMLKNHKQGVGQEDRQLRLRGLSVLKKLASSVEKLDDCEVTDAVYVAVNCVEQMSGGEVYENLDGVQETSPSQVM